MIAFYFNPGLRQEGIYRLSPSLGNVNKLKAALNNGTAVFILNVQCTCTTCQSAFVRFFEFLNASKHATVHVSFSSV